MRLRLVLIALACALVLLPGLAYLTAWGATVRPGHPRMLALRLPAQREVILHLQPCTASRPGRATIWYVDESRRNRLVAGWITHVLAMSTAPPCP